LKLFFPIGWRGGALLFVGLLVATMSATPPVKAVRRVLVFYEIGLSSPSVTVLDQQIQDVLQKSTFQIELYREYLETALFPDSAIQKEIRDWYIHKYRDRKLDLIITIGPSPLRFLVNSPDKSFKETPIVFGGLSGVEPEDLKLDSRFVGVWDYIQPAKTLEAALRLRPATKHVVVVGGKGDFDLELEALFHRALRSYESKLDVTYLTDLTMPELRERLGHLPENTIILLTHIGLDAAGTSFIGASQADPLVVQAANAPVFGPSDVDFGHGEVGGYLDSFATQGKILGEMAKKILEGQTPQNIPVVRGTNVYVFDARALKHWGMSESDVPADSVVLNRQPSVWDLYKSYIIVGTTLLVVQMGLIFGLLWQRRRRRLAEAEVAIAYDRLRMAVEAGKSVGWDWDIPSGRNRWFGDLTIFGLSTSNFTGRAAEFRRRVYPDDWESVSRVIEDARRSGAPYAAEFRIIRDDHSVRWISARGRFYYASNGDAVRMLGMAVDITERKIAEEALTSLSGRLIEAQDDERKRIAREIHDDYQQRLAMVAIELEETAETCDSETGTRLRELWNGVSELGADLHSLSHSLHSSTLERLGLVAGIKAFCEEFSDLQEISVDFVHKDVPRGVPSSTALCLFRIVQEGLRNVKRHSGADSAEVRLELVDDDLHLTISDHGKGFDPNNTTTEGGIGIRSMEERLRLLGGKIEIRSRPMQGTTVVAFLPFRVEVPLAS
jgi:PAS domain S-box-containing protein